MKENKIISFFQEIGFLGWMVIFYIVLLFVLAIWGPKNRSTSRCHCYEHESDDDRYERWGRWVDVKSEMGSWR